MPSGTNPRAARIAALIQRVIASSMEAQLHDKRLANVTITEVRVTNDLSWPRSTGPSSATPAGNRASANAPRRR